MKYKEIPFNITLAKLISSGSVCGRLKLMSVSHKCLGTAEFQKYSSEDNLYIFKITKVPKTDITERIESLLTFDVNGVHKYPNGYTEHLVIEIPVEDSCDDDVIINSLADSFVVQEKDPHYHKCKIEPIDYILANNLGFCEGNIVKYITRYKDKGGKDDLRKIKVYVDYLIDKLTKENNDTTSD